MNTVRASCAGRRGGSIGPGTGRPAIFQQGVTRPAVDSIREPMNMRASRSWPFSPSGIRGPDLFRHLPHFGRLYWRLFRDPRISIWPKALLVAGAGYVLSPVDLIPDFLPVIGQVDDVVLLIALCRLFVYLCPPEVVQEHVRRIDAESQ